MKFLKALIFFVQLDWRNIRFCYDWIKTTTTPTPPFFVFVCSRLPFLKKCGVPPIWTNHATKRSFGQVMEGKLTLYRGDADFICLSAPTVLKMMMASPKSKIISYPIRWQKNIFRVNDLLKMEISAFVVSSAVGYKKRRRFFFRTSYTLERYLPAISLDKKITLHGEEANFICKSVRRVSREW